MWPPNMKTTITLQPAYLLHYRAYRDTSALLDLFTPEYGRVSVVAKGIRREKSSLKGVLQPFVPLLISCQGKGDLLTLTHAESRSAVWPLAGEALFSGMYLHEVLIRVLKRMAPETEIFRAYELVLKALTRQYTLEKVLRLFEKYLLHCLGYTLPLYQDSQTGHPIEAEFLYHFDPEKGAVKVNISQKTELPEDVYRGASLLALARGVLIENSILRDAKRLIRRALAPHLGPRPLNSRLLFKSL